LVSFALFSEPDQINKPLNWGCFFLLAWYL